MELDPETGEQRPISESELLNQSDQSNGILDKSTEDKLNQNELKGPVCKNYGLFAKVWLTRKILNNFRALRLILKARENYFEIFLCCQKNEI